MSDILKEEDSQINICKKCGAIFNTMPDEWWNECIDCMIFDKSADKSSEEK